MEDGKLHNKFNYLPEVSLNGDYIRQIRRRVHENPELSGKEFETAALIRRELKSFGIESAAVGGTGTYAVLDGEKGSGRATMLRADIDALPVKENTTLPFASKNSGVMHACGHDIHLAALLGAAKTLSQNRDRFAGRVKFVFQHAEEAGHGSQYFIKDGLCEDTDSIVGFHIAPSYPFGQIAVSEGADAAGADFFEIRLRGKGSHITRPDKGADALSCAVELVLSLKSLCTYRVNPFKRAMLGIGKLNAGEAWNIVAGSASIEGTIRTFSDKIREMLISEIERLSHLTAQKYGAEAEIKFEKCSSVVNNDPEICRRVIKAASELLDNKSIRTSDGMIMEFTSDDFGEFSSMIPGCFFHIGVAAEGRANSALSLHSDALEPEEESAVMGADIFCRYVFNGG